MQSIATQRSRGIDRAIELLECLHDARQPLRIAELAARLKAPRSTTYALVERFLRAGLLARYGEGGVFFGRAMHFYGADYVTVNDFSRRAQAAVQRLAEATRQTAQFTTLRGNKYTVEHMACGNQLFRISTDIGVPVPIPWTASGRLLLGHLSRAEIVAFIPPADFTLPDGRRIAPEAFCLEVARASAAGFCTTRGLVDNFTSCMAAAVRDAHGVTVGCLCLVVPSAAAGQDALLRQLCEAAVALTHEAALCLQPPPAAAVAGGAGAG
jgi:DNA-binding IclR family transcriptional regulator